LRTRLRSSGANGEVLLKLYTRVWARQQRAKSELATRVDTTRPLEALAMRLPRVRFRLRTLLILPAAVALILVAIDPFTARPCFWRNGSFEFDVVNARDRRAIRAYVTMTYEGPLAGQPGSGDWCRTLGAPYETYRGYTPDVGYGGLVCIVRHRPGTLIFRRHDQTIVEGVRFRVEAEGYEPFEFAPVDPQEKPLVCETWDPPVFRVELRRHGASGVPVSWSTRPELKLYEPWFPGR
jgi:hypothetical protein